MVACCDRFPPSSDHSQLEEREQSSSLERRRIRARRLFFSLYPELAITRCVYLNPTPPPGPRKRGGRRRVSPCTAVQDEIDNSVPV
jgi:hypothetical protein